MRKASLSLVVLAALAAVPSTAKAQLLGIDGMMSTVMQESQSSFSGLAFRARIHPLGLIDQLELMPTFEYWRNSSSIDAFGLETTRKDATLGADMRYVIAANGWEPYVGAGWALHFLTNKVNAPGLGLNNQSESVTLGALSVMAGAGFGLTDRIDNFLELKYQHVPNHRQFKLSWGFAYNL